MSGASLEASPVGTLALGVGLGTVGIPATSAVLALREGNAGRYWSNARRNGSNAGRYFWSRCNALRYAPGIGRLDRMRMPRRMESEPASASVVQGAMLAGGSW